MRRPNQKRPGTSLRLASLIHTKEDALSRRDLVRLAASARECVVRVTGGAALIGDGYGDDVGRFLAESLGGSACDVAVLAGATMSIDRPALGLCIRCDELGLHCPAHSYGRVKSKPGVMSVLMNLAAMNAPARTIGLVPVIGDVSLYAGFVVVSDKPENDYYTVIDDRCPFCLVLQFSTDKPTLSWDDEWRVSIDYMELLRNDAQHRSLHLAFNGGVVTRNECLHVAALPQGDNPWNLVLVEDSGRAAEALSNDLEFRRQFPHVVSCRMQELSGVIREMGFAPEESQQTPATGE